MTLIVIILGLFSSFVNSPREREIDYYSRQFQKEVNSILNSEEFKIIELAPEDPAYGESRINGKFFTIHDIRGENLLAYIGRVYSCRSGGCINLAEAGIENGSEYFDYFIIFDARKKVKIVRVFNYVASHGQEITVKRWLDQFIGFDGIRPLRIGKEIDSISGATISVSGLVADLNEKTMLVHKYY